MTRLHFALLRWVSFKNHSQRKNFIFNTLRIFLHVEVTFEAHEGKM